MALAVPDKKPLEIIHARLSELRPGLMAYVMARVARKWETVLPGGTIPINGDLWWMTGFSSDKVVEGKVYKILHFEVLDRKKKYKSIPAEFTIYFNSSTKLIELTEGINKYPRYFLRFADMIEIRERSEKDPVFTDVIGMFVGYGEPIAISVSHISHLNLAEFAAMAQKPIFVVAATTVREYSETKFLSSSSATKVYVNPDIPEAEEIRQRFRTAFFTVLLLHCWSRSFGVNLLAPEHTSQSLASTNAKDAVILELLYLTLEKAQGQKFRVEAEVTEVDTTNGWYYESCPDCHLKLPPAKGGGYSCTQHGRVTPKLVMQLTLMIKDDTSDLEVAVFGPLAENLISVNLANEVAERTVNPKKLPACANDIIGNQFIFILGVSDQTVKGGWRKFNVFAYTGKQASQPLPPSVKGKQILGSTSHPALPIFTDVIDPSAVNQDS
ncbi:Nucleic acid-binding protein [Corchorus capsularis]|uniref:Nucleic acid-binding protein n=1 Tax=Corchorus capsularis TaxID=210143 RepID=A0A1R3GPY6_COCAP|nr:Nucleic acid-binding protein [Corchorus capsularis]